MKTSIFVENIKCGGCSNSIQSRLEKIVTTVSVNIDSGKIDLSYTDETKLQKALETLDSMGYPEIGKSKLSHKAKSYVNCMIGRVKKA